MNNVNELHAKAMSLVDEAHLARLKGLKDQSIELTKEAFLLEAEAARKFTDKLDFEPTRSVLFRSAATLALECGEPREAERLISSALAGTPPDEIANELRDLLENVYFARHLDLRGVNLAPGELQMTIDGDAVGFGIAKSELFVQRLKDFEKLIYRTAERKMGREFREQGRVTKNLTDNFEVYLSVPRAASFAVTLRLGQSNQMLLPGLDFPSDTIDDLLNALEVFAKGDNEALEAIIPDKTYRTNFLGLAERISPDGQQVKSVGFTSRKQGIERKVALICSKSEIRTRNSTTPRMPLNPTDKEITITGTLLKADATRQNEGVIKIVDSSNNSTKISVTRGLMSDIVKPMFEEWVQVVAIKRNGKFHLVSIDQAERNEEGAGSVHE